MTQALSKTEEYWVVLIALLAGAMLAAHQLAQSSPFGLVGGYVYWVCRILIETGFFIAVLLTVETYLGHLLSRWVAWLAAIAISLVPFTLAIIAFDLILGLPELGLNSDTDEPTSRFRAFGLELIYLADNHLALCLLLLVPRMLKTEVQPSAEENEGVVPNADFVSPVLFIDSLEPPLDGRLCSIEAQEHYIRVTTTAGARMVLYRFSDAIKQLPETLGMQVHRSHWVAFSAVRGTVVDGQSLKLNLYDDRVIPVSRTFRTNVESRIPVCESKAESK